MNHLEIREKFINFFKSKGHTIVPSSSLIPNDPSVLFTTAGMQQFKPYYTGQADTNKDFNSLNTASIQKCVRTSSIDEVGDISHLTFFEMLGNFSFGGYWKKEAIQFAYDFITKGMGLKIDYVSVFGGEESIPADDESESIWRSMDSNIEVRRMGREDNFWGPTGNEGPCGPSTEVYINGVEIWNIVFNQYYQDTNNKLEPLKIQGIDTGMGLERLAMVVQGKNNIFETDLFSGILDILPSTISETDKRIFADHCRSSAFLISDGALPSNKEQGYVLRRLLRRIIAKSNKYGLEDSILTNIFTNIVDQYRSIYSNLNIQNIINVFSEERSKFEKTLKIGIKEMEKMNHIAAEDAFKLYESFGLPFEVIKEYGGDKASDLSRELFDEEFKKHQEISRAGLEKKFGGHGLIMDTGELKAGSQEDLQKATRLHTATHLLQAGLRKVLGPEVKQSGSDINPERLRFDFSFSRKMTPEEIKEVEDFVNNAISKNIDVSKNEMKFDEAIRSGALAFFKQKYPETVNVYSIGDVSKELCGGPHVSNTGEIGIFKIQKEESVSAGVRRIKAVVQ